MPKEVFLPAAVVGSLVIDALIIAVVAGLHRMRTRDADRAGSGVLLLQLVVVAGLAVVMKAPVHFTLGSTLLGLCSILYWEVTVLPVIVGAAFVSAGIGRGGARSHRGLVAMAVLTPILIGSASLYARHIEPRRLQIERTPVSVDGARAGEAPLRIGVLADLQTDSITPYEHEAIERLMAEAPDVILIPGDLYQTEPGLESALIDPMRDLIGKLDAPGGVYLVPGDHDRPSVLESMIVGSSVRLLMNEVVEVTCHDRTIRIGGLASEPSQPSARRFIESFEAMPGDDDIRLLLAHRPRAVGHLTSGGRVDLTVAGHTHGGQVVVPGFGPPITLSPLPRAVGAGGLHDLDGCSLYVSRGVGMARGYAPRIRFCCPPEISILTIR
jgi:predicted MPP superfamily phosphohydrolase